MFTFTRIGAFIALFLTIVGCSKEQRDQLAQSVSQAKDQVTAKTQEITQQASASVEAAAEQVAPDGESNLKVDGDHHFEATYANLVVLKDRKSVFQLRSYPAGTSESYPAYYFQGQVSSQSLNSVKEVAGTLFVKASAEAATLCSSTNTPVTLRIDQIVDGKLTGRFVNGQLQTVTGKSHALSGTFEAVVEGGLE